ncbi:MAG: UDP-glucose 4-epimerase [Solirubrobacteraceae bacterium]|jgi:UDP-glucose 4-epimerase|nr:UDP-glucose 4-epimerase [Solirubrobacteraceae bacterium]
MSADHEARDLRIMGTPGVPFQRDLRDEKVVVVGGAGLIGSHVVERLLDEPVAEIVVYDNFTRGRMENLELALPDERVRLHQAGGELLHTDVLADAFGGANTVFHLAALWLLHCHEYPRSAFEVNVRGTFNVMEACVAADVERLVSSSSASVYGNAMETPMTEAHPFNNRTFYGATKIAGEAMLEAFHHRYGLSYASLRYMNVYGARQDYRGTYIAVIMKMLDRLDEGLPPIIEGTGDQSFDFIYVSDVAEANLCAAKSSASGPYNVGTGVKTSIRELAEHLLELTGSDLQIEYVPQRLAFVDHRVGSTELAREELGFGATIELREGLRRVIEWRAAHIEELAARQAQGAR